jgi:MFS family permease
MELCTPLNYLIYTLVVTTATCASLLTINNWGRYADRIGNIKVLKLTSFFITLIPFFWVFYQHPFYLILVQVFSGFVWAGFNLCASNFIYDAVSPAKRTRCISYFNVLNGVALCLGALLGGYLAQRLPHLFGFRILSLFLISTVLRLVVAVIFSGRIEEVRSVEKVKSINLFYSVIGLRPLLGITRDTIQTTRERSQ